MRSDSPDMSQMNPNTYEVPANNTLKADAYGAGTEAGGGFDAAIRGAFDNEDSAGSGDEGRAGSGAVGRAGFDNEDSAGFPPQIGAPLLWVGQPEAQPFLEHITHIYTDLDGTLLAPGGKLLTAHDGSPSAALAQALVALKAAGIEVIIVTGRNGNQGQEFLRLFDLETFIGELGCMVMVGTGQGQRIYYELGDWANTVVVPGLAPGQLPPDVTPYQLMLQVGAVDRLIAAFPGKLEFHAPYPNERTVTHALRGFVDNAAVKAFLATEELPLELKDNGVIHPQEHTLVDCPEIHVYHLVPQNTSKARAVKADMERRGLNRAQTLAIGDAAGDVEMGEHTGSLVVLGNALESKAVLDALEARGAGGPGSREIDERGDDRTSPHSEDAITLYTRGSTADGWVEFAQALLAAR